MSVENPVENIGKTLELLSFRLHDKEFCVQTSSVLEVRRWEPAKPLRNAPADVIGMMNLRGAMIPVIDMVDKLGLRDQEPTAHSAIMIVDIHGVVIGLIVDSVSDISTISESFLQPVPEKGTSSGMEYADGVLAQPDGGICFLNLERIFDTLDASRMRAA